VNKRQLIELLTSLDDDYEIPSKYIIGAKGIYSYLMTYQGV